MCHSSACAAEKKKKTCSLRNKDEWRWSQGYRKKRQGEERQVRHGCSVLSLLKFQRERKYSRRRMRNVTSGKRHRRTEFDVISFIQNVCYKQYSNYLHIWGLNNAWLATTCFKSQLELFKIRQHKGNNYLHCRWRGSQHVSRDIRLKLGLSIPT